MKNCKSKQRPLVVLVQPPIEDYYETRVRAQPLGLCYLKAAVGRELPEVDVRVLDLRSGFGKRTVPAPAELSYLKDFYPWEDSSPFGTFHNYCRFGADTAQVARAVSSLKPWLVGISSLFSPYYREVTQCARAIKIMAGVPIVVGGAHASACPESLLSEPSIDFVVRGEGERPMCELIRALLNRGPLDQVPNLAYKYEGGTRMNPPAEPYPFEGLPWPDLSDLPMERYLYRGAPMCMITATRGCPHRCSFCSVHSVFGAGFRARDPEDVFREMKHRFEEGYRVFDFEDDNLAHRREDFLRLLRLVEKGLPVKEIRLLAMNGISYTTLDPEVMEAMRRAGFEALNISLVSRSGSVLSLLNRPAYLARFRETVECARGMGYKVTAYQIIGIPGEGLDSMIATTAFLGRLPLLLGPSVYYNAPGSSLAGDTGRLTGEDLVKARSTAMAVEGEGFSRREIYSLFAASRIENILKSERGIDQGREVSFHEALGALSSQGERAKTGVELLMRLMEEGVLYAATGNGLRPLPMFEFRVLRDLFQSAGMISTLTGGMIRLEGCL